MATRLYDVITQNSLSTDQKSHIRYLPSRSHIYPQDVWLIHMSYRKSAEMFASKEENLRTLLIFLLFLGSRLLSLVTLCLLRIGCIFFWIPDLIGFINMALFMQTVSVDGYIEGAIGHCIKSRQWMCDAVYWRILFCDAVHTEGNAQSNYKMADRWFNCAIPNVKCREGEMVFKDVGWESPRFRNK